MKVTDFLQLYRLDPTVMTVAARLNPATARSLRATGEPAPDGPTRIHLRGLVGSQDAVLAAAAHTLYPEQHHLFVLHDKDEASYFLADLQHLLPDEDPLIFPSSYKRPYQFDETENANVLMRAEVLNRLSSSRSTPPPGPLPGGEGEPSPGKLMSFESHRLPPVIPPRPHCNDRGGPPESGHRPVAARYG